MTDIRPGTESSVNRLLGRAAAVFNGELYFSAAAENTTVGSELWKSDGTAEGTVLAEDIYEGVNGSSPSGLILLGNKLIFSATAGSEYGAELYYKTIELRPVPQEVVVTPVSSTQSSGNSARRLARQVQEKTPSAPAPVPTTVIPVPPPTLLVEEKREVITSQTETPRDTTRNLQIFLNSVGFTIVQSGPGSPGN